jgi:uncharacterized membrane protein YadS
MSDKEIKNKRLVALYEYKHDESKRHRDYQWKIIHLSILLMYGYYILIGNIFHYGISILLYIIICILSSVFIEILDQNYMKDLNKIK